MLLAKNYLAFTGLFCVVWILYLLYRSTNDRDGALHGGKSDGFLPDFKVAQRSVNGRS